MTIVLFENPEQVDATLIDRLLPLLPPERQQRVLRGKFHCVRAQSAIGYLLLWYALRTDYGIVEAPRLEVGEHGKPYLRDHPAVFFNISHCRAAVACVVSDRPVGIDVQELIESPSPALAAKIAEPQPATAFSNWDLTCLWTQKEASAKLHGDGLSVPLASLPFADDVIQTVRRETASGQAYALSVAVFS
ncbi:MAG: hypothetical protein IJU16_04015 [Clostridia bacterium]|nr:hypothetical protein [Clostridia bacterium]